MDPELDDPMDRNHTQPHCLHRRRVFRCWEAHHYCIGLPFDQSLHFDGSYLGALPANVRNSLLADDPFL